MTDWDAVVGQNVGVVRRTIHRLIGNDADTWDCVQETFLDAVKIDRREPVRNWPALLRHLATVRALDLLRMRAGSGTDTAKTEASPRRSAGNPVRPARRGQ